jgi:transposase
VKLSSVASDVLGVTGRMILDALCAGERDPDVLAKMARSRLRSKIGDLRHSVPGRFNSHHAGMVTEIVAHVDYLTTAIVRLDARVEEMMVPFRAARELLTTIPGIQQRSAEIILAEIGVDMTRFATAAHLASWAGVCPGNNESAGKHRSTHTRSGDPWLQSALVEAASANIRSKNSYLAVRFWRIAKRRGQQRALIAVAHTLLIIIWHMLNHGTVYTEIGVDYLARNDNPDRRRRHLVNQLQHLGYHVELTPAA